MLCKISPTLLGASFVCLYLAISIFPTASNSEVVNLGTLPNEGSNLQKDMGVALVGVNSAGELILETSKASLNGIAGTGLRGIAGTGLRGIAGTGLRGIAGTGLRSDPDC